jgi:hypothetical protein
MLARDRQRGADDDAHVSGRRRADERARVGEVSRTAADEAEGPAARRRQEEDIAQALDDPEVTAELVVARRIGDVADRVARRDRDRDLVGHRRVDDRRLRRGVAGRDVRRDLPAAVAEVCVPSSGGQAADEADRRLQRRLLADAPP